MDMCENGMPSGIPFFVYAISPESSRMEGRFTCTDMRIFDGQRTAGSLLRAGLIKVRRKETVDG